MKNFSRDEVGILKNKNEKLKSLKFKTLAFDYLTSIALNNNSTIQNTSNINQLVLKEYDYFSKFYKINNISAKQKDFFIYYKKKLKMQNLNSNRFETFLKSEFGEKFDIQSKNYIEKIFNDLPNLRENKFHKEDGIQSIKIVKPNIMNKIPSIIMTNTKDIPISDSELEFIKNPNALATISKNIYSSKQLGINSSNFTLSSTSSTSIQLTDSLKLSSSLQYSSNNKSNKMNNFLFNELEYNTENHHQLTSFIGNVTHGRKFQRTVSESSNESYTNFGGFLSLNKNVIISTKNRHYKPLLFNFLRRLNNEKIMFLANNSTIGLFSRLPFKSNLSK
jgi:hypothetical protein